MNRVTTILIAVVAVVVIAGGALYWSFLAPTEEASGPLEAVPLVVATSETEAEEAVAVNPTATTEPTEVAEEPTAEPEATEAEPATEVVEEPTATTEPTEAPTEAPTEVAIVEPQLFEIQQAESTASFVIDEVLNGSPKTVIGTTNQVAGQLAVNPADTAATQIGVIQINARTFATDSENRNRAIQNRILETNSYELITFTPTSVTGLPESVAIGDSFTFQVTGDLTITDATQPVTFDVTVTAVSEDRLEGQATATIAYADWGLSIPSVPQVASVEDTLQLNLDFVAAPAVD